MQRCRQALNPALHAAHAQLHFTGCSLVQATAVPALQGCLPTVLQQAQYAAPVAAFCRRRRAWPSGQKTSCGPRATTRHQTPGCRCCGAIDGVQLPCWSCSEALWELRVLARPAVHAATRQPGPAAVPPPCRCPSLCRAASSTGSTARLPLAMTSCTGKWVGGRLLACTHGMHVRAAQPIQAPINV